MHNYNSTVARQKKLRLIYNVVENREVKGACGGVLDAYLEVLFLSLGSHAPPCFLLFHIFILQVH